MMTSHKQSDGSLCALSYKHADGALRALLTDAIVELCRRQSFYVDELRIEATVCIVSDRSTVVIAQISEQVGDKSDEEATEDGLVKREAQFSAAAQSDLRTVDDSNAANEDEAECDEIDETIGQLSADTKCDSQHWNSSSPQKLSQRPRSQPINRNQSLRLPFPPRAPTNHRPGLRSPKTPRVICRDLFPPSNQNAMQPPNSGGVSEWKGGRGQGVGRAAEALTVVAYEADGSMVDGASVKRSADGKFACPYCDKSYGFKHTLKDHINKHLGRRPHVCKHCPTAFTHLASLCAHVKRCHDDTLTTAHRCTLCGEKFTNEQSLKQHHTWRHRDVAGSPGAATSRYLMYHNAGLVSPRYIPKQSARGADAALKLGEGPQLTFDEGGEFLDAGFVGHPSLAGQDFLNYIAEGAVGAHSGAENRRKRGVRRNSQARGSFASTEWEYGEIPAEEFKYEAFPPRGGVEGRNGDAEIGDGMDGKEDMRVKREGVRGREGLKTDGEVSREQCGQMELT